MLAGCCPSCGYAGELEAFLIEPEAKRALARVAAMEPVIGKLIAPYLRLFASGKRGLQLRRAVRLMDELMTLVEAGDVARDERTGVRRPASPAMWAAGIEKMLASPPSGTLENHNYLRAIVFSLADSADAKAERQREEAARQGRRPEPRESRTSDDPLVNARAWAQQQITYGAMTQAQAEEYLNGLRSKLEQRSER